MNTSRYTYFHELSPGDRFVPRRPTPTECIKLEGERYAVLECGIAGKVYKPEGMMKVTHLADSEEDGE